MAIDRWGEILAQADGVCVDAIIRHDRALSRGERALWLDQPYGPAGFGIEDPKPMGSIDENQPSSAKQSNPHRGVGPTSLQARHLVPHPHLGQNRPSERVADQEEGLLSQERPGPNDQTARFGGPKPPRCTIANIKGDRSSDHRQYKHGIRENWFRQGMRSPMLLQGAAPARASIECGPTFNRATPDRDHAVSREEAMPNIVLEAGRRDAPDWAAAVTIKDRQLAVRAVVGEPPTEHEVPLNRHRTHAAIERTALPSGPRVQLNERWRPEVGRVLPRISAAGQEGCRIDDRQAVAKISCVGPAEVACISVETLKPMFG